MTRLSEPTVHCKIYSSRCLAKLSTRSSRLILFQIMRKSVSAFDKKKTVKVLCVQLVPIYCLTHLAVSKSPYGDVERKVTSYENITVDILKRFVLSNVALPPPALLLLLFLYLSVLLFRCHNSSTLFLSNHWN